LHHFGVHRVQICLCRTPKGQWSSQEGKRHDN
jgi:hypothetical protein